ncbi:MAG: hypothetical protein ACFBSG_20310 [Leptolyngbyaceae cyanobacterium]
MDFEQAKLNPASVFESPAAVSTTDELTSEQKVEVLRQWEYDAQELQVAAEENMAGGSYNLLAEVLAALRSLDAEGNPSNSSPTKQGGA